MKRFMLLSVVWLASCSDPEPAKEVHAPSWSGVFHHEGRNLELRSDGRFRLTVKGCVFMTIDVKGHWTARGDTTVLRADGDAPMGWGMFSVIDQLELSREGTGIMVSGAPRLAPEIITATAGREWPPELANEHTPFRTRWLPGRVCTSCSETEGTKTMMCTEDEIGPW